MVFTLKGIAEAGIPDRYSMISKIGQFFILLMTMDLRQSEKRHFIASSDEESNDVSNGEEEAKGGSEKERSKEYHRCVMVLVEKIVELCDSKYGSFLMSCVRDRRFDLLEGDRVRCVLDRAGVFKEIESSGVEFVLGKVDGEGSEYDVEKAVEG